MTEQSSGDAQDPLGAGSVSSCDLVCTRKATCMSYSVTLVFSGCKFCLAYEDLISVPSLPCGTIGKLFICHTKESFVQAAPASEPVLLRREVTLCLLEPRGSIKTPQLKKDTREPLGVAKTEDISSKPSTVSYALERRIPDKCLVMTLKS